MLASAASLAVQRSVEMRRAGEVLSRVKLNNQNTLTGAN